MPTHYKQYGALSTTAPLPVGVSTASVKQVSDKYYGNLIRSSDSPNNYQAFHSYEIVTDTTNVLNCIPPLGSGDGSGESGSGYILTEYNSEPMKGQLAKVTLVYSAFSEYTPYPTYTEQSSTRQVSITQWADFVTYAGTATAPLNGAIFESDSGVFQGWAAASSFAGNDQMEVGSINYTYTEYSTSEFSSDAEILGTIQEPTGAPVLPGGGNWLLAGSNRGKSGYFYNLSDTYVGSTPEWNTTIYAA